MNSDNKFKECAECAAQSGSPLLCDSCVHNRAVIGRLQRQLTNPVPIANAWVVRLISLLSATGCIALILTAAYMIDLLVPNIHQNQVLPAAAFTVTISLGMAAILGCVVSVICAVTGKWIWK